MLFDGCRVCLSACFVLHKKTMFVLCVLVSSFLCMLCFVLLLSLLLLLLLVLVVLLLLLFVRIANVSVLLCVMCYHFGAGSSSLHKPTAPSFREFNSDVRAAPGHL